MVAKATHAASENEPASGTSFHNERWELVVGLEVHAQLRTRSKAYSAEPNAYGDHANTLVGPVSLGLPGALPVLNASSLELGMRLALAVDANIAPLMHFARKNYFYPDLPKGYQISQDSTPLCTGGRILVPGEKETEEKVIRLVRIHLEEDAGKSIHDVDPFHTLVDLNRAGVPLAEIVTEPDVRSAQEAFDFLVEVRRLVRYLDVCDGNMEEGSLRCDANISVRPKGSSTLGTRTEVKNLNSFRNVQRAIVFEAERQVAVLEAGGTVRMETRTFDAAKGTTQSLRSKEMAHDYRYFPEPDLQPVRVRASDIERVRATLPPLPRALRAKYTQQFQLSPYDAAVLTDDKATALYYETVVAVTKHYKAAANWVIGPVRSWLNEHGQTMEEFRLGPERLASLVDLVESGGLSYSRAAQSLFPLLLESDKGSAKELAQAHDLLQDANEEHIASAAQTVLARYPDKVAAYRAGNHNLLGLFMGEVMKASKGKADPRRAADIVKRLLDASGT
jgi:aspartyl-tRNA(Asn)/glutamyl-tRNA(Gln) amidotransferase subunit B